MPGIHSALLGTIKTIDFRTSILFTIDKENRQTNDLTIWRWDWRLGHPFLSGAWNASLADTRKYGNSLSSDRGSRKLLSNSTGMA